ncbi:hypothetical protein [Aquimarina algiphila]|uniref:hypothetical protein n=1 Tax=Aquimarina algiphila TaxID=2047982 RepID=UPI002492F0F6|nr:hypothetical protein [Aquimarina algiphila]
MMEQTISKKKKTNVLEPIINKSGKKSILDPIINNSELISSGWSDDQEKIYDICKNYFELCLACARDEFLYNSFMDPRKTVFFLTDGKWKNPETGDYEYVFVKDEKPWQGVGMTLPEEIKIIFDPHVAWPTLYITSKADKKHQNTITIKEAPLLVEVTENSKTPSLKIISKEEPSEHLELPISKDEIKDYDQTLIMPSYVPNMDMLLNVKLKDSKDPEIIMTCC